MHAPLPHIWFNGVEGDLDTRNFKSSSDCSSLKEATYRHNARKEGAAITRQSLTDRSEITQVTLTPLPSVAQGYLGYGILNCGSKLHVISTCAMTKHSFRIWGAPGSICPRAVKFHRGLLLSTTYVLCLARRSNYLAPTHHPANTHLRFKTIGTSGLWGFHCIHKGVCLQKQ